MNKKYEDDSVISNLISEISNNGFELYGHHSRKEKVACSSILSPLQEEKIHNPQTADIHVVT